MKKLLLISTILTMVLFVAVQVADAASAQGTVKSLISKFKNYNGTNKAKASIERILDAKHLGQKAMSTHWDSMNSTQKQKFNNLIVKLIRNIAYTECKIYYNENHYTYGNVTRSGSITKVPQTVSVEGLEEPVIFYMKKIGNRWRIEDIELLDSTMVIDYKNQFNSIINKEGVDGLLKRMEKRINQ